MIFIGKISHESYMCIHFFLHKIKDEFELNIIMSVFQLDNCLSDEQGKKLLKYILRYNS
jgi:hypothetical protein